MDCVKAKAWKDFIVKNSILPPAYDRVIKEDDNPTPFCMTLKNVEGIEVVSFLFYSSTVLLLLYSTGCTVLLLLVGSSVTLNEAVFLFLANDFFHG